MKGSSDAKSAELVKRLAKLKLGMVNSQTTCNAVSDLQNLLLKWMPSLKKNYQMFLTDKGKVNGQYDEATENVVLLFKTIYGIKGNGAEVGKEMARYLVNIKVSDAAVWKQQHRPINFGAEILLQSMQNIGLTYDQVTKCTGLVRWSVNDAMKKYGVTAQGNLDYLQYMMQEDYQADPEGEKYPFIVRPNDIRRGASDASSMYYYLKQNHLIEGRFSHEGNNLLNSQLKQSMVPGDIICYVDTYNPNGEYVDGVWKPWVKNTVTHVALFVGLSSKGNIIQVHAGSSTGASLVNYENCFSEQNWVNQHIFAYGRINSPITSGWI